MGTTTTFEGTFTLDKPLTEAQREYLVAFSEIAHYAHGRLDLEDLIEDHLREAVELPAGPGGAYVVSEEGDSRLGHPPGVPGAYCQWTPTEDGSGLEWDGGEKFYDWAEWLTYLVDNFLKPWGLVLNGRVAYQGEKAGDAGYLVCTNNMVEVKPLGSEGAVEGPSPEERAAMLRGDIDGLTNLFLPNDPGHRAIFLALCVNVMIAARSFTRKANLSDEAVADVALGMLAPLRRFRS
jgi:hypothetical protein